MIATPFLPANRFTVSGSRSSFRNGFKSRHILTKHAPVRNKNKVLKELDIGRATGAAVENCVLSLVVRKKVTTMSSLLPAQAGACAANHALSVIGEGDVFDAFLLEFKGGTASASRDARENPSTSTSVFASEKESDGGRRKSRSNVSAEGASSRLAITGEEICVEEEEAERGEQAIRGEEANRGEEEQRGEEDNGESEEQKDKGGAINRIYSVHPYSMASTENFAVPSAGPTRSAADAKPAACRDSEPATDKVETAGIDRAVTSDSLSVKGIISHSSVRSLTNATYLRRLNLSREDAFHLFPQARRTLEPAFEKDSRRVDSPSRKVCKRSSTVGVQGPEGKQWQIVLECLFTSGQRHVRLTNGWDKMCSANGVSVGNSVRLDRWEQAPSSSSSSAASREAIVTVSIV